MTRAYLHFKAKCPVMSYASIRTIHTGVMHAKIGRRELGRKQLQSIFLIQITDGKVSLKTGKGMGIILMGFVKIAVHGPKS